MPRRRRDAYHRRGLALGLAMAAILAPVQLGVGDLLGRTVAHNQPAKLAALEGQYPTERGAGLSLGSIPVPGQARTVLNLKVPDLLSVLAKDDPHATIRGLSSFPKQDRTPMALPVRLSFLGMVGIGTYLIALSLWYWLRRKGRPRPEDRLTLFAVVSSGPLAFLANELGWLSTEFGRQPWLVYNVFRTKAGITTAPGLGATFTGFTLLYMALAAATIWLLRRLATGPDRARSRTLDGGGHMSLATVLIVVGLDRRHAYAVLGGADFGAGILHLLARGTAAAAERRAIATAMGPVWEANHVWLIFVVTAFFSAFPRAFRRAGHGRLPPATLAVAIVVRGCAFAFAGHIEGAPTSPRRRSGCSAPRASPRPSSSGQSRGPRAPARARRRAEPLDRTIPAHRGRARGGAVRRPGRHLPRRRDDPRRRTRARGLLRAPRLVGDYGRRRPGARRPRSHLRRRTAPLRWPHRTRPARGPLCHRRRERRRGRPVAATLSTRARVDWAQRCRDRVGLGHRAVPTARGPRSSPSTTRGERPRADRHRHRARRRPADPGAIAVAAVRWRSDDTPWR